MYNDNIDIVLAVYRQSYRPSLFICPCKNLPEEERRTKNCVADNFKTKLNLNIAAGCADFLAV